MLLPCHYAAVADTLYAFRPLLIHADIDAFSEMMFRY